MKAIIRPGALTRPPRDPTARRRRRLLEREQMWWRRGVAFGREAQARERDELDVWLIQAQEEPIE